MDDCAFQLSSSIIFAQVITSTINGKKLTSKFRPDIKCPTHKEMPAQLVPACHSPWTLSTLTRRLAATAAAATTSAVPATRTHRNSRWHFRFEQKLNALDKWYRDLFFVSVIAGRRQPWFWCVAVRFCVSCSRDTERSVLPLMPSSWLTAHSSSLAVSVFACVTHVPLIHSTLLFYRVAPVKRIDLLFSIPANV